MSEPKGCQVCRHVNAPVSKESEARGEMEMFVPLSDRDVSFVSEDRLGAVRVPLSPKSLVKFKD